VQDDPSESVRATRTTAPETRATPADETLIRENLRLKEELLNARDTLVGQEARLGEALGEARRLEAELVRYQERMQKLDRIERSPLGWILRTVTALRALASRRRSSE